MTTEAQSPAEYSERVSVRKSLALAAAHGIGPFKKRVPLATPEPDQHYDSFSVDVKPKKQVWDYKGKVAYKPLEILTAQLLDTEFRQTQNKQSINKWNEYVIDTETDFNSFRKPEKIEYAFSFSRNGMSYQVRFRNQDRQYAPYIEEFTISEMSGLLHPYGCRPMTKQEAEYALEVIEAEYPYERYGGEIASYHAETIKRLRKNLPQYKTAAEAEENNPHTLKMNENKHEIIFDELYHYRDVLLKNLFLNSYNNFGIGKSIILYGTAHNGKTTQQPFNKAIIDPGSTPQPKII